MDTNGFLQLVKHTLVHSCCLYPTSIRLDCQGVWREFVPQYSPDTLGVASWATPFVVCHRKAGSKGPDEVLSGLLWHEQASAGLSLILWCVLIIESVRWDSRANNV